MSDAGALVIGGDYRGLGIVRSLGRQGVPVWVVEYGDKLAGYSRYSQRRLPWPGGTEAEQLAHLIALADTHGLDDWVLFPTTEEMAWLVSRNHATLAARYRLTTSPWEEYAVAVDKRLVYRRAQSLGIDAPRTWYPENAAEVAALELDYPVILKPAMRITHNPFTDEKAWLVNDRAALIAQYESASKLLTAPEVMIQEVVTGGGDQQLAFACVCRDGEVLAHVTVQRSRQYPIDFGRASTFVETIDHPEIVARSRRLLADLQLTGMVEVEFKHDTRDDRIKLLDVNARSWGWHSLGAAAGTDFAYLAWREARGEVFAPVQGRTGVRWVRLSIDLPVSAREIAGGRLRLRPYLWSLRPPLEGPISALDDPRPAVMDLVLMVGRAYSKIRRPNASE